ncbi:MAG: site-specific DNA-methyltransferase [Candidatus Sumerlaeia bacterium]|nr:site-specific DNA-methyltransferase [Candidatus Sumerlaeia bacterium]
MAKKPSAPKSVEALKHADATRKNIPTAEYQAVVAKEQQDPLRVAFERRNRDLDPQLVWRGKDLVDWSDLVAPAPPLYIQEKIHPKALIDDLLRRTAADARDNASAPDLFGDFNGFPEGADKTEFYAHDGKWSNRMILGDSLQVMASLAEREGLRGKVQCIYLDPPYGIKFNSNFQWSTTSRDVKDGNVEHITREPEQVKAFRDTWRDGIHSYLTYLRDRLTVARELLTESGSIFVQIGDENVHRVRALMDEVFGEENFVAQISSKTSGGSTGVYLSGVNDFVLWYARNCECTKFRMLLRSKDLGDSGSDKYGRVRLSDLTTRNLNQGERLAEVELPQGARPYRQDNLTSQSVGRDKGEGAASWFAVRVSGREILPSMKVRWKTNELGMSRLQRAERVEITGESLAYVRYLDDFSAVIINNSWTDVGGVQSRADPKVYVVQTPTTVIQRCLLMATDPGDLVLDPTCGSGTTAYVAEQWGRRWITIDTSRVALALARARLMGARYPYYLLADSPEGQAKEAEVTRRAPSTKPTYGNIRHGFVYERVPHITLKSIANNAEIDVIWETHQPRVAGALDRLNAALRGHKTPYRVTNGGRAGKDVRFDAPDAATFTMPSGEVVPAHALVEWEVPREAPAGWPAAAAKPLADFWEARIARQREMDKSIAAKADTEYLYDKPYDDKKRVRVAGPFTVESLSPHRVLGVGADDELIDSVAEAEKRYGGVMSFADMILENLRTAGVQQAHKEDKIAFTSLVPWAGEYIGAEGRYTEGSGADAKERRAGIFIGPEFGTVSRPDLVAAAREAGDANFDVLIACAFNYDAHSTEFAKLGRIPILKARMNADLHMADDLKNTGKGNLFVIFGEPDIDLIADPDGRYRVKVNGVDVFRPNTGEVVSDSADGIACWFLDTDYNEESFFVRHAYFLGANDPYKALKTTLKAEINEDAWATLNSDTSRPFDAPKSGRIAVKVINHLGDEVMKVFRVGVK